MAEVDQELVDVWAANRADELEEYAAKEGITVEETAARFEARAAIGDVVIVTNEDKDTFTGSYFTHDANSYVFHIVVKEGASVPDMEIPASEVLDVVWETAPRSKIELRELRATLVAELGENFVSIGTNVAEGRLVLTVEEGTDLDPLVAAYGAFADVKAGPKMEPAACVDNTACTPWRGGIYIQSTTAACTYGFTTRGDATGAMRMLSADHCNHVSGDHYTWYHNGATIGTLSAGLRGLPGDFFKAPRPAGSTPRNLIYYSDNQKSYVINSVPVESAQDPGDPIHMVGANHFATTGDILDVDQCWWVQGNLVCGAIGEASLTSGDSGGPTFYGGAAYGIISATGGGETGYSFITRAEDELNVSTCINSACDI